MTEPLITIYTDGLCEPNPAGWATWGWVAYDKDSREIAREYDCLGFGDGMTNNRAEYEAVLQALRWAEEFEATNVLVRTDSELLANQVNGTWRVKNPSLVPLHADVCYLLETVNGAVEWVPREQNTVADGLSREAYEAARQHHAVQRVTRIATVRIGLYGDDPVALRTAIDLLHERLGEQFHQTKVRDAPKGGYMAHSSLVVELLIQPETEDV